MARTLDITAFTCPMTWVRTKLELERMAPGEALEVRCREGEALENVPRSAGAARPAAGGPARGGGGGGERAAVGARRRSRRRGAGHHDPHRARVNSRRGFLRDLAAAAAEVGSAAREAAAEPVAPAAFPLSDTELDRYGRQLALPEWGLAQQAALREARVLVVGVGALGSPVALYLAGAGVGRLGILDHDGVELSNLHRQLLHFTPDVGVPKAESAAAKLGFLNPDVVIEPYQVRLEPHNAAALVEGQDLVVDCSDAFATRYAVNAACCAARVPLVEAGVSGF